MPRNPDTVRFDVGGTIYRVSRSLIEQYPDTMLARITSETWAGGKNAMTDADEPIFLERDGARFRYVLDYMRDGEVDLPTAVSRKAFLRDMDYYGFDRVDDSPSSESAPEPPPPEEGTSVLQDCDLIMKLFARDYTALMTCTTMGGYSAETMRNLHVRQNYVGDIKGISDIAMSCYPTVDSKHGDFTDILSHTSYDVYEAANRIFGDRRKEVCLSARFLEYGLRIRGKERKERDHGNTDLPGKQLYWEVMLCKL